jgi:outer membrane immunogenic protein
MSKLNSMMIAFLCCAPALASAQDWSGAYAGGSISFGMAETEVYDSDENTTYGYTFLDGFTGVLSGRVGYNFQSGALVYGPEMSVGLMGFDESLETDFCSPATVSSEISGIATMRGRMGFAIDNVLVYGTAGVGYLDAKSTAQCDSEGVTTDSVDGMTAFVAGIGAEYMYSEQISMTFEYLAVRGRSKTVVAESDSADIFSFDTDMDLFSVGVNYHF